MTSSEQDTTIDPYSREGRMHRIAEHSPEDGMWNVIISSGEQYERSYESSAGLFKSFEEANEYKEALDASLAEASEYEVNQYTYTYSKITFVPFGNPKPVFHNVYSVVTERDHDDSDREIYSVTAIRYTEEELLKQTKTDARLFAIWNDRSLAVLESGVKDGEVVSSAEYGPLPVITYEDEPDAGYVDSSESFLTMNPANVVLTKS